MRIRRVRPEEAAVERYVEELWIPYHRDLSASVGAHGLAELDGLVATVTEHTLELIDTPERYLWVAIEDATDPFADLEDTDGRFVGFLLGGVEASPSQFDWPDRFILGDLYVDADHRGSGLARRLVERAADQAREDGCSELALDVDLDNERALAFYEKLGFSPARERMRRSVEGL